MRNNQRRRRPPAAWVAGAYLCYFRYGTRLASGGAAVRMAGEKQGNARMDAFSGPPIIRLHPDDGVAIARNALPPGAPLGPGFATARRVPAGHKVARRPHAAGGPGGRA